LTMPEAAESRQMPPTAKQPAEMSKPSAAVEVAPPRKIWLEEMSPVMARLLEKVEVPAPPTSIMPVVVLLPVMVRSPPMVELAVEMKPARVVSPVTESVPVTERLPLSSMERRVVEAESITSKTRAPVPVVPAQTERAA